MKVVTVSHQDILLSSFYCRILLCDWYLMKWTNLLIFRNKKWHKTAARLWCRKNT